MSQICYEVAAVGSLQLVVNNTKSLGDADEMVYGRVGKGIARDITQLGWKYQLVELMTAGKGCRAKKVEMCRKRTALQIVTVAKCRITQSNNTIRYSQEDHARMLKSRVANDC